MENNSIDQVNTAASSEKIEVKENGRSKRLKNASTYFLWGLTGFLTVIACMSFYFIINNTAKISVFFAFFNKKMMPVYVAMIVAYLLSPIVNFIENKWILPLAHKLKIIDTPRSLKNARGVSILITMVLTLAVIVGLIILMISQIVPSVQEIVVNFEEYVGAFQTWIRKQFLNNPDLMNSLLDFTGSSSENIENWLNGSIWSWLSQLTPYIGDDGQIDFTKVQELLTTIMGGAKTALGGFWNVILGIIISIYLLGGKEKFSARFKKITYSLFKKERANRILYNTRFTHKTFIGYLTGKIIDSIIVGILCFIGTTILNNVTAAPLNYAALVSLFVGVTNIIPYFGPILGAIPSAILIFVIDPMHPFNAVIFLIFILILQQVDGNLIGPKILGDSTGLEGFWVIFSITVFGAFFGIPGMIIGIPTFAVIYAWIKESVNRKLATKGYKTETEAYIDLIKIDDDNSYIEELPNYKKSSKKGEKEPVNIPIISTLICLIKKLIASIKDKSKKKSGKSSKNNKHSH